MKVAYLMNGVIGGLSGRNSDNTNSDLRVDIINYVSSTHKFLHTDNIEIDYFIFSWEPDLYDTYVNAYHPKQIECQSQLTFNAPHYGENEHHKRVQSNYSRWFGARRVMQLCTDYCNHNNVQYDLVVNARLDLCFHNSINLHLDSNKFHITYPINLPAYNWPALPEVIDHIFVSNMYNMKMFLSLFDHINEYTQIDQCPRWKLISSHMLAVWHLRKIGLLNTDIIKESFTTVDSGYDTMTDYHIFRDAKPTREEIKIK